MSFIESLKETLNEDFNYATTENGALAYRTTGKQLLDINFKIASMRQMPEKIVEDLYAKTFYENKLLAVK